MSSCLSLTDFLFKLKVTENDLKKFQKKRTPDGDLLDNLSREDERFGSIYREYRTTDLLPLEDEKIIYDIVGKNYLKLYTYFFAKANPISASTDIRYFFRGIPCEDYKPVPGIYRKNEQKEESFYSHELQVRCPEKLAHLNYFNKLTYMQHYGVPTRLLDITTNPLVALYFACSDAPDKNGKVYMFGIDSRQVKYETSDRVQMLAHFQNLSKDEQENLRRLTLLYLIYESFPQGTDGKYLDPEIERLYYSIQKENPAFRREIKPIDLLQPVFVQANHDNPRILKQDGAFILSGLEENETSSDYKAKRHVIKELFIPAHCKQDILGELDMLSIHKGTLFPEFDMVAQYLKNK